MQKVKIYQNEVRIDRFGRYSLTDMNKPYGKNLTTLTTSKDFEKYVGGLVKLKNENKTKDFYSYSCNPLSINSLYEIKKGTGDKAGTWIHEDLVVYCARWLNVDFSIACDQFIRDALKRGSTRLGVKASNVILNAGVKENLIDTGLLSENGAKYIFSNISKLICKSIIGVTPSQYLSKHGKAWRDDCDAEVLGIIKDLETQVGKKIERGRLKSYNEIREFIKNYVNLVIA